MLGIRAVHVWAGGAKAYCLSMRWLEPQDSKSKRKYEFMLS